jgi:hypothetical protein
MGKRMEGLSLAMLKALRAARLAGIEGQGTGYKRGDYGLARDLGEEELTGRGFRHTYRWTSTRHRLARRGFINRTYEDRMWWLEITPEGEEALAEAEVPAAISPEKVAYLADYYLRVTKPKRQAAKADREATP